MNKLTADSRESFAEHHGMSIEFVNWFMDEKKDSCGAVWLIACGAMWEGWKARDDILLKYLGRQGGWISCSERMPKSRTGVLVGCWFGKEWATKWATLVHGHPDASDEGWLMPGASWVPTHWHELPAPPQLTTKPQADDGWIEWKGGRCPVDKSCWVEVKLRNSKKDDGLGWIAEWRHTGNGYDIIAYRVIENDGREG